MIKVQFSRQHSFTSYLIQWGTFSHWSHVDIILPDGKWLGARSDGGVQARNPYQVADSIVLEIDLPDSYLDFAISQEGKKYDWGAVFAFPFHHNWGSKERWFCFELVAATLKLPMEHLNRVTAPQLITAIKSFNMGKECGSN